MGRCLLIKRRIILVSGACPWNCYFCGYGKQKYKVLSHEELKEQVDNYFRGFEPGKIQRLKVDIPGSFLDPNQVPLETRRYLVEKCKEYGIREIEIETRPEFVNKKNLSHFKDIDLTVAIGLDVADDYYLKKLNEGFSVSDYENSARIVKSMGFEVKTYVLVNPPFVDDKKEILDKTVREALNFSDTVVLVNCYPHEGTPLKEMMVSEETGWEPLSKEEFFELTKKWLVKPNIEYDLRKKEVAPIWKAWVPRFSERNKIEITSEELKDPKFETWQKFLRDKYNPPESKDVALFLPDLRESSTRDSHEKIESFLEDLGLKEKVHELVVSSPGIIPAEFMDYYPFDSYECDLDELSEKAKERYIEITTKRIEKYIQSHKVYYTKYLSLFKQGGLNYRAVKKATKDLHVNIENRLEEEDPTSEASLKSVKNALKKG